MMTRLHFISMLINSNNLKRLLGLLIVIFLCSCSGIKIRTSEVGPGWAKNSINTVIFRQSAITSDQQYQFTAYYDNDSNLVLARREIGSSKWKIQKTQYQGNTKDAHNAISIALDGDGFLHVSWDHHDSNLKYAVSKQPLSLKLGEMQSMTGKQESKVSYPQFYNFSDGDLLFMYRSGQSGKGSLVLNHFNNETRKWKQIQNNLIDGEGERNAYWQASVDKKNRIHLSWTWRETWDVSTNHDIAYAVSSDKGKTWKKSSGETYTLPINQSSAEIAWEIPQKQNLINQTSMTVNDKGLPFISSYWEEGDQTQFQIVYFQDGKWKKEITDFRNSTFDLGGGGTKSIPISRPEILVTGGIIYLVYRDAERNNRISLAYKKYGMATHWKVKDLTSYSVGQWEPNYDRRVFKSNKELHLFVQNVKQEDAEGLSDTEPTMIKIVELTKLPKK